MSHYVIKNARIINEENDFHGDVYIRNQRIEKISSSISIPSQFRVEEIDANGMLLIPGVIDAHVHFRDPGLTYKGDIASESKAAIAGGVTSFMDMPNTMPNVTSRDILEKKYAIAAKNSICNFSFFMGLTKDNLEEALKTSTEHVCGITDDGLYFDERNGLLCNAPEYIEKLFSRSEHLIALHSENEKIIAENYALCKDRWNNEIPPHAHSIIRSDEACIASTKHVIQLAKQFGNRLHVLHVSTGGEARLFDNTTAAIEKRITSEVCVHHLCFNTTDYEQLGNKIKWNPSIKSPADQAILLQALKDNNIDMIATDHAPHDWKEKNGKYEDVNPGGPMIQHALPVLLEMYHNQNISLKEIVKYTSHRVADVYRIKERGYLREGYFADLAMIDLNDPWRVTESNIMYKCNWSPLLGNTFHSKIKRVMVNGALVYDNGFTNSLTFGMRMKFNKTR